jgi:hypothetical protein
MIILTHTLYLRTENGQRAIEILIHQPVKDGTVWKCRHEVDWPEGRVIRDAVGQNALQALMIALNLIGADIYTSTYHREGRLRVSEKERGYGFPVPSSLRDLLVGYDAI